MPKSEETLNYGNLAVAAHKEDRADEALKYYLLHLSENPLSGEGWFGLGTLFHTKIGNPKNAIYCYRKAIELIPSTWLPDLHLGILLCDLGRPESAIIHLDRYVRANPHAGRSAYSDLACAYVRLGRLDEAHEVAAVCRRHYPDDYFASFLSSWVAAKQGNLSEAIYHAADSAALDPMCPFPLALKGLLLSQAGQLDESRRMLQEMSMIQCAGLMSTAERRIAAIRLWREIRHDAKQRLGIHEFDSANFLILTGGLGDQFCMASMLSAFRAANKGLPLVVFSSPSTKWEALFPNSADMFLQLEPDHIDLMELCNRFFPDQPYQVHYLWFTPLWSIASLGQVLNFTLGLPTQLRGRRPTISDDIKQNSLELFHGLGGKAGRSVLISTVSNSNPMLGHAWWQALVDELDRAGFVVFENSTNTTDRLSSDRPTSLERVIPVDMPPEQVIPFCEAAGFFVGIRSGLCDLLGYAKARMKAIHVTGRFLRYDRYPLAVSAGAGSSLSVRLRFDSDYWEDITVDDDTEFDPSIVADWVRMPALPA
jgi:hypothetical protein